MDFNCLLTDLTSADYHGMEGTYSSSQLKTMLEDPEVFHKKYILKTEGRLSIPAFDIGTYFHTAILEPEKLEEECIVYTEGIRSGKKWEAFKELHKDKAIITLKEKETAEMIIAAVKDSPISMDYVTRSKPEVSAFVKVYVLGGEIFTFKNDVCMCLTATGWCPTSLDYEEDDIKEFGTQIVLKVRADSLGIGFGTISDLKSTSGNVKNAHEIQGKVSNYKYELSAALYLDLFTIAGDEEFDTFVWIFASKDIGNACSYKASQTYIMVGRAMWKQAVVQLAKYIENDWAFTDELYEVDAPMYAREWIK